MFSSFLLAGPRGPVPFAAVRRRGPPAAPDRGAWRLLDGRDVAERHLEIADAEERFAVSDAHPGDAADRAGDDLDGLAVAVDGGDLHAVNAARPRVSVGALAVPY